MVELGTYGCCQEARSRASEHLLWTSGLQEIKLSRTMIHEPFAWRWPTRLEGSVLVVVLIDTIPTYEVNIWREAWSNGEI